MRILLTGATGFLGSRVLPLLEGHEVVCLARRPERLPALGWARALPGDLADPRSWEPEIERFAPHWCIHLAWEGLPDYSFPRCRANLVASTGLVETLVRARVGRVVVAGSCWEYGNASGAVTEQAPPANRGVFAATKEALRLVLESVAREAGFEWRWARVFFAYGPGQRAGALIPQCHAAYAAGREPVIRNPELAQDFVHVDDVARGIVAIAASDAGSGIFNIGSGRPTPIAHVVNRVAGHFGRTPPFALPERLAGFWADTSRTEAVTGWRAQTAIDAGIAQTLNALRRAQ